MNTKAKGDLTEAMILAGLLRAGKNVLKPFGDNQRYDLVVEENGTFSRIQCKTGRVKLGAVTFKTCSTYAHRGRESRDYRGEADVFGVYCPDNDTVYMVPVNDVGIREGSLRIDEPKNGRTKGIRWAEKYIVKETIGP